MSLSSNPGAVKMREWRAKNPEKARAKSRRNYQENKEKCRAYTAAWRLRNPARWIIVQSKAYAKKTGCSPITDSEETVQAWIDRKPKCCQIPGCERDGGMRGLHLDHDHITGKIRGWLCAGCNHILGYIELGWVAKVQAWKDSLPE